MRQAEILLAEISPVDKRVRDETVRAAHDAGVSKMRIHQLTGLARTTVDRILAGADS